ncbi:MAG: hypothetical protein LC640_09130 [Frankia sp.]|nr:hypothetical protein [Frankia sp.]
MQESIGPGNLYRTAGGAGDTEGVAVSGTTTYYGTPMDLLSILNPSLHLEWTGTPTGTFTIWASNKRQPNLANDADWFNPPLAVPIVQPAGSASKDFVDLTGWPFRWCRPKYVNASGTGTINAYPAGK